MAVELTERGLGGRRGVFENARWFFAAYGRRAADVGKLDPTSDGYSVVDAINYKPYAMCVATHPVINAIKSITREHSIGRAEIVRVLAGTSARGIAANSGFKPADTMGIQCNIGAPAALALLGAIDDLQAFDFSTYTQSSATALSTRVEVELDDAVERVYPARIAGRVTIELKDGSSREAHEPGLPDLPTAQDRLAMVKAKFRRLTTNLLKPAEQDGALNSVAGLRHGGSVAELCERLRLGEGMVESAGAGR